MSELELGGGNSHVRNNGINNNNHNIWKEK
jgi:hypothetical protein